MVKYHNDKIEVNWMKRILLFVLSLMMVLLLLCSCNKATNQESSEKSNTESPSVTDIVNPTPTDDSAQIEATEPAIGWIDAGVARFYVPEEFVESDYEGYAKAPGVHSYSYTRPDLNMNIDIACLAAPEINLGSNWLEDSYDYYCQTEGVTYNTSSENSFTVSGCSSDNVYYINEVRLGDRGIEVSINYPAANKNECDRILEDFMKNLSY